MEKTNDYFAQDKAGNVWYFGEDTKEFENGKVVSTEGTWRAGVDGATPGIIMLARRRSATNMTRRTPSAWPRTTPRC